MIKDEKVKLSFLLILSAFMAFTSLSTDIYLPAMPAMQSDIGGHSELTVTGFVIGFAIAQLIWGPISDHIGRRKPLYIGTAFFVIGSIICAIASTMPIVVFGRVIQAIGACTGPMISRAMIRDLFSSSQSAQILSTLMMIMAAAPIIGPLLGGMLLKMGTWRLIFWLMMIIGVLLWLTISFLPESLKSNQRSPLSLKTSFKSYYLLLKSKLFMIYTLSVTFFYVAVYAFITGSSSIYINYFHVSPEGYSLLFGLNIVGVSIMSMINRQLVSKLSLSKLLLYATGFAFLISIILAILSTNHLFGLLGVVIPMFLIFATNGIIAACANAEALNNVPRQLAGSAAALIGALQYGSGVIPSILLAVFADKTAATMSLIMMFAILVSAVMAFWGYKMDSKN